MPKVLSLDEATKIISQINTLDAKLQSLISMYDQTIDRVNANNKEITRLETLKKDNDALDKKAVVIKGEVEGIKGEIHSMSKTVTEAGWVIPIPKRDVGSSSIRI